MQAAKVRDSVTVSKHFIDDGSFRRLADFPVYVDLLKRRSKQGSPQQRPEQFLC